MFMKLGQFLSALCGEKFVTSPATRSHSSDGYDSENESDSRTSLLPRKGDEGVKPFLLKSSRGPSHVHIDPAAKVGNGKPLVDQRIDQREDVGHYKKKIDGSLKSALLLQKKGDEEQPWILKSSRGPVFQGHIDPATTKVGNGKPLVDQRIDQREDVGNYKKKIDGSLKSPLFLQNKGDEEKPWILKSSSPRGSVLQGHIDSAAKEGNGKPLIDQSGHYKKTALLLKKANEEKPLILKSTKQPFFPVHIDPAAKRGEKIVWLKHYNNKQKILMVGEGDFSFSASLAVAFGSASNITATSLNNSAYLRLNYKNASENIEKLTNSGATVRHGIDATKMSNYPYWQGIKFDRIIYNFPYACCTKTEERKIQLRLHSELVRGFLTNAKEMLGEDGEIHISHKTNGFHAEWKLKGLAWDVGLQLVREVEFNKSDYPGYETKQGYRGNINFDCYPSSTFMFEKSWLC